MFYLVFIFSHSVNLPSTAYNEQSVIAVTHDILSDDTIFSFSHSTYIGAFVVDDSSYV